MVLPVRRSSLENPSLKGKNVQGYFTWSAQMRLEESSESHLPATGRRAMSHLPRLQQRLP